MNMEQQGAASKSGKRRTERRCYDIHVISHMYLRLLEIEEEVRQCASSSYEGAPAAMICGYGAGNIMARGQSHN